MLVYPVAFRAAAYETLCKIIGTDVGLNNVRIK